MNLIIQFFDKIQTFFPLSLAFWNQHIKSLLMLWSIFMDDLWTISYDHYETKKCIHQFRNKIGTPIPLFCRFWSQQIINFIMVWSCMVIFHVWIKNMKVYVAFWKFIYHIYHYKIIYVFINFERLFIFMNKIQTVTLLSKTFWSLQIVRYLIVWSNFIGDLIKIKFDAHFEIFWYKICIF